MDGVLHATIDSTGVEDSYYIDTQEFVLGRVKKAHNYFYGN